MIKEQVLHQFKVLMSANSHIEKMSELVMKAIDSKVIDIVSEPEDSFWSSKIIYHAVLCTIADEWEPLAEENKAASEALQKYLAPKVDAKVETTTQIDKNEK
jgi:hypothetical protein